MPDKFMDKIKVTYTHSESVARIVFDNGKGNIVDSGLMNELNELLKSFKVKSTLKVIVLEGSGNHFSFGASVEEHRKEAAAGMLKSFHGLFYALADLAVPTIAKISGQCLGGGMEVAIMCNFLFADKTARLGQPEIVLGVFPPPASVILSEKIGLARAEELLLTGKTISAEQGKAIGLLNDVSEDKEALEREMLSFIETQLLPRSASSLRFAVKAARWNLNRRLSAHLKDLEAMYVNELMETHDANEGIQSFIEKRPAVWANR